MLRPFSHRFMGPIIAVALFIMMSPVGAAVYCVDSAIALKNALSQAATNSVDDEIQIVRGTYVGNFVYAVYVSTQANALAVKGGYAVGCASRTLNPTNTILDGNQSGAVLELWAPDVTAEFLVDGLTLRNGKRFNKMGSGTGGGLYAKVGLNSVLIVKDNQIISNTANSGGGIYVSAYSGSIAKIINNHIEGNTAYNGGGVALYASSATLTNNYIDGNKADGSGGGVFVYSIHPGGTTSLTNNHIEGNTADGGGGGVVVSYTSSATLTNNHIKNNTVFYCGGGVALSASSAVLTNNHIKGNTANICGGGLYVSSAYYGGPTTLTNNTLAGNASEIGGGLYLDTGFLAINTPELYFLYNNIFWENTARGNAGADLSIVKDDEYRPTLVTLLANNFDQTETGFKTDIPITLDPSNFDAQDPLFVDAANGDLHLTASSPMIDAGYPQTPGLPETDLDGSPRVLGVAVDIGAYEYNDDGSTPEAGETTEWQVTEIYIATMGYAPDQEGLQYWVDQLDAGIGWTPLTVAQSFFDQPLVQAQYPEDQGYGPFIEALYQNLFGRAPDTEGYNYWLAELDSGRVQRNQMIVTLIEAGWSNPDAAQDMARFGHRVQVGLAFAAEQAARGILYSTLTSEKKAQLRELGAQVLAGITADIATRDATIQGIPALLDTL